MTKVKRNKVALWGASLCAFGLVAGLYQAANNNRKDQVLSQWGSAVQWSDLHASCPYRIDYD